MREIKFRAWDKKKKEMIKHSKLFRLDTSNEYPFLPLLENMYSNSIFPLDVEIMQYTGFKDNKRSVEYPKGQEIYEGDIVNIKYFNNNYIGRVVFNLKTCGFEIWYNSVVGAYGEKATHKLNFSADIDIVVIGNIYENPELLK